ncbi:MAG: endosialidase [Lachnospiraceae bacterium]|nr:endosialidase [Lachnospiraceae bacterium]
MGAVEELLRNEADGSLSFGNHNLKEKAKLDGFQHEGGVFKVKTYAEITKLERDGEFVYESVPGTSVNGMEITEAAVSFRVEGNEDAQITLGLAADTEYRVSVAGEDIGVIKTNLGGKLSFSVELAGSGEVAVSVKKA